MRFLGLDASLTCSGIAVCQTEDPDFGLLTIQPGSRRGPQRLGWILRKFVGYVRPFDPHLVLMEGYAYARANQAHQLGELGGVLRLWLHEQRIPYVEIPPAVLKGYATGKGNASKDDVFAETIRRLGYQGSDNNEADALVLATMGVDHYTGTAYEWSRPIEPTEMPKAHRKWLAKVDWPELG